MKRSGNPQQTVRYIRLLVWLLLPLFVIPCLAVKYSWDVKHRADVAIYLQQQSKFQQDFQAFRNNLFGMGLNGQPLDVVMDRLKLPDDLYFEDMPNGYRFSETIAYLEGSEIVLGFNPDNQLESLTVFGPYFDKPYPQKPMARTQDDIGQFAGQLAGGPVPFVVWLFFGVIFITSRDRFVPLWLMVAWIVFSTVVWLMSPDYMLTAESLVENWPLIWSIAMLCCLVVLVFLRSYIRRKRDPLACPKCGYNLKGNTAGQCPECGAEHVLRVDQTIT
ncbi:MAG: hypothetical protein KTR15_15270 [Phycisphaeraceae bacterium]|nr:hypothetical protein [Phycisphaeraceae bacterium]